MKKSLYNFSSPVEQRSTNCLVRIRAKMQCASYRYLLNHVNCTYLKPSIGKSISSVMLFPSSSKQIFICGPGTYASWKSSDADESAGFCVNIKLPSNMDSFSYGVCNFPWTLIKVFPSMCHDAWTLNCRTEIQNVDFRIPRKEFLSLHQCVSQILYVLDRNEEETTVDVKNVGEILVKTTDEYIREIPHYHHWKDYFVFLY